VKKAGERIGAILGAGGEQKIVRFLGYGVYEGDEIPLTACGWMAKLLVESSVSNPKLRLDNGDVVWGCECWWGREHEVAEAVEEYRRDGYIVVNVRIEEIRAACARIEK